MKKQKYEDVATPELYAGGLDNNAHPGFLEDYRCITALLRTYKPSTVFEIGTNTGNGVNTIAKALPNAKIYSLDLDYESMMENPKEFPIGPGGVDRVGSNARVPYTQLRCDSLTFDYNQVPCDTYFIDGCHDTEHACHETYQALNQRPQLIIWHDANMQEVEDGILAAFVANDESKDYSLYRVEGTRIAYCVRD